MYVEQTLQWIESIVIDLNLCPFAKREIQSNTARIKASFATTGEEALTDFMMEIEFLEANPNTGTTLLIYPHFLNNFLDYLDFVAFVNELLIKNGYEGIYQIATFHPEYCFHGVETEDVTNYTNRSPYPMLHLLREDMLDKAIAYYGNTEVIPDNNIRCLRKLGLTEVKKRFEHCRQQTND